MIVWNNIVPRLSVAYDLTGAGRTVVKASVSEFTQRQGATLINQFNPLRQNTEVRTWTDANGDLVPQLKRSARPGHARSRRHCPHRAGPDPADAVGSHGQRRAPARDNLSFSVSYFRRRYQNLTAVVNTAVTPADYTPLTITNPLDGTPLTIYNQSAATIGRVDNVLLNSDLLTQKYDGVEVTVNRRFTQRLTLFGGITVGSNKAATSASRNPNDLINADGYDPLDSRVILNVSGIYQLPWRLTCRRNLAYYTGQPLRRVYTISRRSCPACARRRRTSCWCRRAPTASPIRRCWTSRFGRRFHARGVTIEPLIEVYNLLNENGSLTEVETVGPSLGRISRNIDGRLVRFSLKVSF